jgi:hypothetical protein
MGSEAFVWLPVVFFSDQASHETLIEQAWLKAAAGRNLSQFPDRLHCVRKAHTEELLESIERLFSDDPGLPAVIVTGLDSPLAEARPRAVWEAVDADTVPPGHAVVALLLSRADLTAPREGFEYEEDNPYTPFWERGQNAQADSPHWSRIPPALRTEIWRYSPIAALHRMSAATELGSKREKARIQAIHEAAQKALVDSGLRDLPFEPEEDDEPETKKSRPETALKKEEAPLSEFIGWLVHNAPAGALGVLSPALLDCGCDLEMFGEASDLRKDHGDTGTATNVLMHAEAVIRAAQLQKAVLMARFDEGGSASVGVVRSAAG